MQFVSGELRIRTLHRGRSRCLQTEALGSEQVIRGNQVCLILESELLSLCQAASLIKRRISLIMEFPIIEINLLEIIRFQEGCVLN